MGLTGVPHHPRQMEEGRRSHVVRDVKVVLLDDPRPLASLLGVSDFKSPVRGPSVAPASWRDRTHPAHRLRRIPTGTPTTRETRVPRGPLFYTEEHRHKPRVEVVTERHSDVVSPAWGDSVPEEETFRPHYYERKLLTGLHTTIPEYLRHHTYTSQCQNVYEGLRTTHGLCDGHESGTPDHDNITVAATALLQIPFLY